MGVKAQKTELDAILYNLFVQNPCCNYYLEDKSREIDELKRAKDLILESFVCKEESGLKIKCNICGKSIIQSAAILLHPPNDQGYCKKDHICNRCFYKKG